MRLAYRLVGLGHGLPCGVYAVDDLYEVVAFLAQHGVGDDLILFRCGQQFEGVEFVRLYVDPASGFLLGAEAACPDAEHLGHALGSLTTAPAAVETYDIDPVHSWVGFTVSHFFTKVPGFFSQVNYGITVNQSLNNDCRWYHTVTRHPWHRISDDTP